MAVPAVLAHKPAVAEGGELRLVIPSAVVRVPAVTGIDRLIPSFAKLDEAQTESADAGTQPPGVTDQLLKHS